MADADARILDMVRKELEKDRSVATEDLFEKAKKIDPEVANLTARQFHAKYPLQVKRTMKGGGRRTARKSSGRKRTAAKGGAKRGRPAKKAAAKKSATGNGAPAKRGRRASGKRGRRGASAAVTGNGGRGDVRGLLLQFAKEVAQADGKAEIVDVLAGLDGWVDRMVSAATR